MTELCKLHVFFTLHENIFTEITLSLIFITLWQSWQELNTSQAGLLLLEKKTVSKDSSMSEQGIFF
jgi:hypothetical protein